MKLKSNIFVNRFNICIGYMLYLLCYQSLAFGQLNSRGNFDTPGYMLPNNCYYTCLDRTEITNDSIADFIIYINEIGRYNEHYFFKKKEMAIRKVGIKKKIDAAPIANTLLAEIKYDTSYIQVLSKPAVTELFLPNEANPMSSILPDCLSLPEEECISVCVFEKPAEYLVVEILVPAEGTIPAPLMSGKGLAKGEEWVIPPTRQEIVIKVSDPLTGFVFNPDKNRKEVEEKMRGMSDILRKSHTKWIGVNCAANRFGYEDEVALIEQVSKFLHYKGYATRKRTSILDGELIKDLAAYYDANGLNENRKFPMSFDVILEEINKIPSYDSR